LNAPAALLFDLDGTLVDSRRDIAEALNAALSSVDLAPLSLERVLPMIGDGARKLVERGLAAHGREPDDRVIAAFHESYLANPCVHTTLLPGAIDALKLGLPCAMVTNKPRDVAILVLEALGLMTLISETWAGGDGPLKPAPDGIVTVCSRLDVSVQNAWMIGDGPQDVEAGKRAGAFTVAVPGIADAEPLRAAQPNVLIQSLLELPALIFSRAAFGGP
jgi:phosphoglycolate phosphatase